MGLKSEISWAERGVENGDSGWESSLEGGEQAGLSWRRMRPSPLSLVSPLHQLELLLLKSDRGFVRCAVVGTQCRSILGLTATFKCSLSEQAC